MGRPSRSIGLAAVAIALAIPALSLAGRHTVEVGAKLKGANEVPGPGDRNGKGEIEVDLKAKKKNVCFLLELSKLDTVTAGHIHRGAEDATGKVKVVLFDDPQGLDGDGTYEGCVVGVKKRVVEKIGSVPDKYYVNVHTVAFPDGAVRGQLAPQKITR